MIAINLSKQKALNAESKAIQQIYFTEYLRGANNRLILFIVKTILDF